MNTRQATQDLVTFFETLSPDSVAQLHTVYEAQARFKDPFNEVQGLPEIERIFRHMYVALEQPHFVITGQVVDGDQAFLTWEFHFRFKRFDTHTPQTVRGASHVVFNAQGLVTTEVVRSINHGYVSGGSGCELQRPTEKKAAAAADWYG